MRVASKIFRIFMWIAIVIYTAFQAMAVYGLSMNNANAISTGNKDRVYNLLPLLCVTILMVLAVVLFTVLKRRRYIGICLAVLASVGMLVVGLDLGRRFPVTVSSTDVDVGLSTGKMIWRHYGIAIVPVFMLVARLFERSADKADKVYRVSHENDGYDLSGGAIFTDMENDTHGGRSSTRKMKRSLKNRYRYQ